MTAGAKDMKNITSVFLTAICFCLFLLTDTHADSVWDKKDPSLPDKSYQITVYRSATCGCCAKWLAHLRKHGFQVEEIKTDNTTKIKEKYNVPVKLRSCHTAIVEGYVIEGHVPANDIKKLLLQKPKILGLSVPQMPVGTPGMEMGKKKDPFYVVSFDRAGNIDVFNQYNSY